MVKTEDGTATICIFVRMNNLIAVAKSPKFKG